MAGSKGINNFHRLHFKWRTAVLGEHGADSVEHNLCLGQVCGSALDEDVLGIDCYLQQNSGRSYRICGPGGRNTSPAHRNPGISCTKMKLLRFLGQER